MDHNSIQLPKLLNFFFVSRSIFGAQITCFISNLTNLTHKNKLITPLTTPAMIDDTTVKLLVNAIIVIVAAQTKFHVTTEIK